MNVNYYCECVPSANLACFDLDSTLIVPKSGHVFPVDKNDWQPLYPNIGTVLQQLVQKNYIIAIFTNQLKQTEFTVHNIAEKIRNVMEFFKINTKSYCYFISYGNNGYRKPMTGMYDLFLNLLQLDNIDHSLSFYCGDAAGRPAAKGIKKDHSYADWAFAQNIGLPFKLPEEVFHQPCDNRPIGYPRFYPTIGTKPFPHKDFDVFMYGTDKPKVVIMVGAPASGKSTLARYLAEKYGLTIFSKDANKTKFDKLVNEATKAKTSMIIDNTNPVRQGIQFPGYDKLIVFHDIPRELCMHLNSYRTQMEPLKPLISSVVYNVYFGKLVIPEENESDNLTVIRLGPEHMTLPGNKEFQYFY